MVGNGTIGILLFLIFFSFNIWADVNSNQAQLLIGDIDGTNAGRYRSLKFTNGSTTNNNDGSVSVTTGGGGGSGNVGIGTIGQEAVYIGTENIGSGIITDNGNVGISSTNPGQSLDVNGTVRMTGFILNQTTGTNYVLTDVSGNGQGVWQPGSGGGSAWDITDGVNTVNGVTNLAVTGGTVGGSTPNATLTVTGGSSQWNGTVPGSIFYNQGLIGLGQSSPVYNVDVFDSQSTGTDIGNSTTGLWNITNAGVLTVQSCVGCGGGSQTPWTSNIDGAGYQLLNPTNIGIATSNPQGYHLAIIDDDTKGAEELIKTLNTFSEPELDFEDANGNYADFNINLNGDFQFGSSGNIYLDTPPTHGLIINLNTGSNAGTPFTPCTDAQGALCNCTQCA